MSRERQVNIKGFGASDDDGQPAIIVESELDPNEVAGRFNIGFGVANRGDEVWFVVLSNEQQILAGTPNSEEIREFITELLVHGTYYMLVDHVPELSDDESDPWYAFDSLGVVNDSSFTYREEATVQEDFSEQLSDVQNTLEDAA